MGKILKDSSGKVLLASSGAFEVTAAIDSNIVAGNIKKDVEILGVTGTYEGSGGGGNAGATLNFYTCSSSSNAKGGSHPSEPGGGGTEPGTDIVFYCSYPSVSDNVPTHFIFYDSNHSFAPEYYTMRSTTAGETIMNSGASAVITVMSASASLLTLNYGSPYSYMSFDPSAYQIAPIYAINYNQ